MNNNPEEILPEYFLNILPSIIKNKKLQNKVKIKYSHDFERQNARIPVGTRFYSVEVERPIIEKITKKIEHKEFKGTIYLMTKEAYKAVKPTISSCLLSLVNPLPTTIQTALIIHKSVNKAIDLTGEAVLIGSSFYSDFKLASERLMGKLSCKDLDMIERQSIQDKQSKHVLLHDLGMTTEFIVGIGDEISVLGPTNVATISLKESLNTRIAVEKYLCDFKDPLSLKKDRKEIDNIPISFKPNKDNDPISELLDDGDYNSAQFIGSCQYYFKCLPQKKKLDVLVYDTKTVCSLAYHITKDRHTRKVLPELGETIQFYYFSLTLDELINKNIIKTSR